MYKILVFGLTPNLGGTERVVYNFFKYVNKEKFHFDFVCTGPEKIAFWEDFERLSKNPVKYYHLPKISDGPIVYGKLLEDMLSKHAQEYDAVWGNMQGLANIKYLKLAKKYGIQKRIAHSHNSMLTEGGIRVLLHKLNRPFIDRWATDFWSCSDEAMKWMFPQKIQSKVEWIHNAIDVNQFLFDNSIRQEYREEFNIKDEDLVIGNVARIDYQKNQEFLLKVFSEIVKLRTNSKLFFVGGGDTSELKDQAKTMGIVDKVIFLGERSDVAALYNMFDLFLLPSRYEGLPVSLLEVQANGTPTLVSDVITNQVIINSNYRSLSLNSSPMHWAEQALKIAEMKRINSEVIKKSFISNNFEIKVETKRLEGLFLQDKYIK